MWGSRKTSWDGPANKKKMDYFTPSTIFCSNFFDFPLAFIFYFGPLFPLWAEQSSFELTSCCIFQSQFLSQNFGPNLLRKIAFKVSALLLRTTNSETGIVMQIIFKRANPSLFFFIFGLFNQKYNFYNKSMWKLSKCTSSIRRRDSNPQPF